MPLASILSAISMELLGRHDFLSARGGFLFLYILIPPLTANLGYKLSKDSWWAFISGLLAISGGYYLPYFFTTDTFLLYMFFGVVLFLLFDNINQKPLWACLLIGILVGLMHLSRSDGFLWIIVATFCFWITSETRKFSKIFLSQTLVMISGYLLVMVPWFIRNLSVFGTILPPGSLQTLWLVDYDQIFTYPASVLTFKNWWSSGVSGIVESRLWALGINLQRVIAEQGIIFLTPLIMLWIWKKRRNDLVRVGVFSWLLTFIEMTFIFPFAGARGGLFHSGAAIQPLFWVGAPLGLKQFIHWGNKNRNWKILQAKQIFSVALVIFAFALSFFLYYQRVIGQTQDDKAWDQDASRYDTVERYLIQVGADKDDIVMVKNPPGYYVVNNRRSVVIPDGDIHTLISASKNFMVRFILLDKDHPQGLDDLYHSPENYSAIFKNLGLVHQILVLEVQ